MMVNNKTLVFSIALEGYERLFKSCIKTHMEYCRVQQYEYVLINHAPRRLDPAEAAWLKVPLMKAALEGGYEWVAFIDADCDIRTHMPCFTKYLSQVGEGKSIFMAPGFSGRINSGVIFVKRGSSSLAFFDTVIAHANDKVPRQDKAPYENGHMIHFGKNNPVIHMLDHKLWNNNSELDDESYIQHYSGGKLRSWYMNNRAPSKHPFSPSLIVSKIVRKFTKNTTKNQTNTMLISESIDELIPFYKKHYPSFRRAMVNGV